MKETFDYKSYRECTAMTLVFSSAIVLGFAILAVVVEGTSVTTVEATMTKWSVPWFLFWYIWCRNASQVKIVVVFDDNNKK